MKKAAARVGNHPSGAAAIEDPSRSCGRECWNARDKRRRTAPHWSLRKMAAVMKVGKNLIARIRKEPEAASPGTLSRVQRSSV